MNQMEIGPDYQCIINTRKYSQNHSSMYVYVYYSLVIYTKDLNRMTLFPNLLI